MSNTPRTLPEERLCATCGKTIHALDGSNWSSGDPMWRHGDCERAARIDYARAFDILYQRTLRNEEIVDALVEATAREDGELWEHDGLLMQLYVDDSTHWATYETCIRSPA